MSQPALAELPPIVLVVEDHTDTRDMYESALSRSGLWVASAAEPDEAFDCALDLKPDSILMDVGLPTAEAGLALARSFRENARFADTPIIAVTGLLPAKVEPQAALFSEVLFKPVSLRDLIQRLTSLSVKSRALRARSEKARQRVPELLTKSNALLKSVRPETQISKQFAPQPRENVRDCPRCHKPLRFAERRILDGATFDYYLRCAKGCGSYCWDYSQGKMIALME